ncbi:JAB N-terminal domain-containing protein [Streptomyces griseus]|uniref:JAB N-terminal domain-containing protein n=1 Tax=Streptomyces griseus TaxID=1911 RepID=UPI00056B5CA3|nr:JAB N-terminal domain-containing protein [Streptomyces griseus]
MAPDEGPRRWPPDGGLELGREPQVELFWGEGTGHLAERLPMVPLLEAVLAGELREHARDPDFGFVLLFHDIEGRDRYEGPPEIVNLRPDFGHLTVLAHVGDRVLYQQPHSVTGLLGPVLAALARSIDPAAPRWSFRVDSVAQRDSAARRGQQDRADYGDYGDFDRYDLYDPYDRYDAYDRRRRGGPLDGRDASRLPPVVTGTADVDVTRSSRLSFGVRRVEEPEAPRISSSDRHGAGLPQHLEERPVTVLLTPRVQRLLEHDLRLSLEVEEGGFLLGKVYRRPDSADGHVVIVEHVLPAEHSGASHMHFTFTGDSFRTMSRVMEERHPEDQLLGWYHTHLFSAVGGMGLSRTDVELHRATFRRPWQVAALINISGGRRVVRCYSRSENSMEACPLWSRDDDTAPYRLTRPSLGRR